MSSQIIKLNQQLKNVRQSSNAQILEQVSPVFQHFSNETNPVIGKSKPEFIEITEQNLNNQLQNAYQEGFGCGCQEQEAKYLQEYQHRFGLIDNLMESVQNEKKTFLESCEGIVVKLSLAIAKKILKYEVSTKPEGIKNVVRQALKKVSHIDNAVMVQVNPADKEILMSDINDLAVEFTHLKEIEFQADDRIKPGGCLIESNSSTIDATIETQLREIEQSMFKEFEYA